MADEQKDIEQSEKLAEDAQAIGEQAEAKAADALTEAQPLESPAPGAQAQKAEAPASSSHAGLVVLEVLFIAIAVVYFAAFATAIFGLPVRVGAADGFVSAIAGITPQLFPVIPMDVTQGTIYISFIVIFLIAAIAFWITSRQLRKARTSDHDERRKEAFEEIDKAYNA